MTRDSDDQFIVKLRKADTVFSSSSPSQVNLAERVRRRHVRQRATRIRVAVGAFCVALLPLFWRSAPAPQAQHLSLAPQTTVNPVTETPNRARRENDAFARLTATLDEQLSRAATANSKRIAGAGKSTEPEVKQSKRRELPLTLSMRIDAEATSLLLVEQGERLGLKRGLSSAARAEYERAVKLFPDSHGAVIARRRLAELNSQTGGV